MSLQKNLVKYKTFFFMRIYYQHIEIYYLITHMLEQTISSLCIPTNLPLGHF